MADKFQLKALITGVDKLSPTLAGIRKNVAGFRKQMNSSGLGNIGFKDLVQGGAFAAPFIAGARAAMEFETAMADVRKVVDFETPKQFEQMGQDVLDMSERLPMAATGIAAIVAAGGQAGFAAGELRQFAEDAVKMGIAFDQTAEQSGDMMAKWRTSFKLTQPEVVKLADQINYLSNVGPSSAAQISDIVTRIGPLGAIAGLASGQIAAMGATLAGVGVPSEVAATGMKNFMLALTKGSAATKQQAEAFRSLRLDVKDVSKSMQKDAQGTIEDVLERIAKVDPAKQAGLLTQLFGSESVTAIAPLLTNLDLLKKSFDAVGAGGKFAGSMEAEFTARSKTTANAMQLLTNKVNRLGVEVGSALLPPFNDFMTLVGPLVSELASLASQHPGLIKGVLGAAVAYGALRVAVTAAIFVMKLLDGTMKRSIVGLAVMGIALAAGVLIANWSTVAPYFQRVWQLIQVPVLAAWDLLKAFANWGPIALIRENWEPLTELFGATWNLLMALSTPVMDYLKTMFDWSPLGMIINNWGSITAWFQQLWEKLRPIIEPIMKWFGGGEGGEGIIQNATDKVNAFTEAQQKRNAGAGGGTGELLLADATQSAAARQAMNNQAFGISNNQLLQQTAATNGQKLNGELNINLNGAPPGTTIEQPKTNQPGLNIKPNVGTRTVGVMKG
ncbi:phage tail tape measure protein [Pseudomonas sp. D1-36]|uniref:phage tail tape measure protein n=1 Tax=Pseudomonas sp. D1-36 TaxID=2817387 RepID=UPI003DA96824